MTLSLSWISRSKLEMATPENIPQGANNALSQEVEDLRKLNDLLGIYVDNARSREVGNAGLLLRITESETEVSWQLTGLKAVFETELADARATLESEAKERARLELEVSKLREEIKELKARNTKKESDLAAALQRLKDLEALLNSKDASLTTALGEKRRLETNNGSLEALLNSKDASLTTALGEKPRLETENRSLAELQGRVFDDSVRGKLDTSLEDAQNQLQDEMLRSVDGENRIQTLKKELEFQKNLHSEVGHDYHHDRLFDAKVKDLEEALSPKRDLFGEKDREMVDMRERLEQKLDKYQALMDFKLALDLEISAYRSCVAYKHTTTFPLIAINVSTFVRTVRSTTSASGKRKRPNDTDSEASSFAGSAVTRTPITQQASASGQVTVDEAEQDGKYVRLSNKGDEVSGCVTVEHRTSYKFYTFSSKD
ncbi:lamin-A-like [Syngnathus typhle]